MRKLQQLYIFQFTLYALLQYYDDIENLANFDYDTIQCFTDIHLDQLDAIMTNHELDEAKVKTIELYKEWNNGTAIQMED